MTVPLNLHLTIGNPKNILQLVELKPLLLIIMLSVSGEAQYTYDLPSAGRDLYAALVTTSCGPAVLEGLDPSEAFVRIQYAVLLSSFFNSFMTVFSFLTLR